MNKYFIKISGALNKSLRFLFLIVILQSTSVSQTASNLDRFYTLIDTASNFLLKDLGDVKKVNLELNFGTDYSVFANQVRGKLLKNGVQLIGDKSEDIDVVRVNFVLDDAYVEYSEPEKDGLFGDFYTVRTVKISGNYFISGRSLINDFKLSDSDTINVDKVELVENRSYPFTRGELPPEPFFASILEPAMAIGAAAITIALFFSVRSK